MRSKDEATPTSGPSEELVPLRRQRVRNRNRAFERGTPRRCPNAIHTSHFDLSEFEASLSHFQSQTVGDLASQLDELQHRTSEHLTNLVHETSDEADAFTVELTTRQPQQTKQVDDAIDEMIRHDDVNSDFSEELASNCSNGWSWALCGDLVLGRHVQHWQEVRRFDIPIPTLVVCFLAWSYMEGITSWTLRVAAWSYETEILVGNKEEAQLVCHDG